MRLIKKGQSILELMIVMALLAILLPVLLVGFTSSRSGKAQQQQRLQAAALLKEAEEAVRTVRESGWNNIPANGDYYAQPSGSSWSLIPVSAPGANINGLNELITIGSAYRQDGVLVSPSTPGAIIDPSTKAVTIDISWLTPFSTSINSTLYLTRLDNIAKVYTTRDDFLPENGGTVIKDTSGSPITGDAEVTLGAGGGGGDWCNPSQSITTVNLSRQGIPTAISAIQGSIVTGTGGNASGPTFAKIIVSGNEPPQAEYDADFDNNKANGVFRDTDKYGYLTTTDHSEEVKIFDLTQYSDPPTNSKLLKVGFFNAPGQINGTSVAVLGNVGYMTTDNNKFYTFDLSTRIGSRPRLGTYDLSLAGNGKKIVVTSVGSDTYAFIAVDSATTQFQVVKVTDPSNPTIVRFFQAGNNQPGTDVSINSTGTRAYLVTSYASGNKDFFIINTSDLSLGGNLPKINDYDTGGMSPKGVAVVTGNKAIIVGTGGSLQYIVLRLENEASLTTCGTGLAITNGAFGISSVLQDDGYAYSYVVTGDANAELKIILGGGGGQYTSVGTYESPIFDPGDTTAFNRFTATINMPSQTDLKMQVAVADKVSGSCSGVTYTYVGPDKTNPTGSFYIPVSGTIVGAIPYLTVATYKNPGQCFRYKLTFASSDSTQSPTFFDLTLNYSP